MTAALLLILLGQAEGWANGRPPECADTIGRAANVWERAKSPQLRHYCDLVASASSKLVGAGATPSEALEQARRADDLVPHHAAPKALEGRALAALGQTEPALAVLQEARSIDPSVLEDPTTLLVWARTLARAGQRAPALEAYRALLSRASALPNFDRSAATVEAGLGMLAAGPANLDDAIAALRASLRADLGQFEAVAALGLALALDRRGDVDESRVLLTTRMRGDPRAALSSKGAEELLVAAPDEALALRALALESSDPAAARDDWQRYVARSPEGPWAAHAHIHARLSGGGRLRGGP